MAATSVAFWLAHVYAHALAHSVASDQRISLAELRYIAGREGAIVGAAVPPLVALLVGEIGLVSTQVAIWGAFLLGLVVLAAQGFTVARIERLGWAATTAVVAANLGLGVLLVGLKLVVSH